MRGGARVGAGRKTKSPLGKAKNLTLTISPRCVREIELLHGVGINISEELEAMVHQLVHDMELISGDIVD